MFLRQRGVWVLYDKRTRLPESLAATIQEESPIMWTDEKIANHIRTKGHFNSQAIAYRLTGGPIVPVRTPFSSIPLAATPSTPVLLSPSAPTQAAHISPTQTNSGFIPPQQPTNEAPNLYVKELGALTKLYTEENKYNRDIGGLTFKLTIFHDLCRKAGVPPAARAMAFSTMLKGRALDYYYSNDKLRILQHGLPPELRIDRFIYNKIMTACRPVDACLYACYKPAPTLAGLIDDLRTSISTYEAVYKPFISSTFFVDRRFHKAKQKYNRRPSTDTQSDDAKRCFICKEKDCISYNHIEKECEEAKAVFKKRLGNRFGTKYSKRFDKSFCQYLVDYEGELEEKEDQDEADLDTFEALFINTSDDKDASKDPVSKQTFNFMTSFGPLTPEQAVYATNLLVDLFFKPGLLNGKFRQVTCEDADPFTYAANASKSRYIAYIFFGIMIDTGASMKSTVGYNQYLAYQKIDSDISIGKVERYHTVIRRAYQIISEELPDLDKDMALQMAFKAVNDIAGPNRLVPMLLVFGAYLRMSQLDALAPTIAQRSAATKKAIDEVCNLRAQRQLQEALRQTGNWTGPFKLMALDDETCKVKMPSEPTDFRSTVVKPFLQDKEDSQSPTAPSLAAPLSTNAPAEGSPTRDPAAESVKPTVSLPRRRGRPRNNTVPALPADISIYLEDDLTLLPESPSKSPTESPLTKGQYFASRQKELNELLEKGVFKLVPLDDVPLGTRIFNSRFVDEVKHAGTSSAFEKSRLVIQAYNNDGKKLVLTQSPIIQRVSQRLILSIASMLLPTGHNLYLRDISQAYVQSTTELNRDFYVRPPKELKLANRTILKVIKPLYGVPEAGNHWFKTYYQHHVDELQMTQSTYDPCLLYTNSLGFGLPIDHKQPLDITSTRGVTRKSLTPKDQYVAQRAKGAYIATVYQPKAAFDLSFAAQQIDNAKKGLQYVQLDRSTLQLIAFIDASFANNKDLSLQIGYVICKRVTRSVLASELYGMAYGFDIAAVLKSTIEKILGITLPLVLCTDSKSLYDCLVKLGTTQEKRLIIDLMCLRQSYERRKIAEIKWIDSDTNPADAMIKSKACPALKNLINTNRINLKVAKWVERGEKKGGI
ncbi:hypothetical protein B7494_g3834 [Chlorociboria aeruginascens]|nr:hypothetical protein B7494_g3834 [Chlorociboria aeruginascens]